MKLLLFDIDGTLILTGGAGAKALNQAFRQLFDIDDAMQGVSPHGKTDPAIIREVFAVHGLGPADSDSIQHILDLYVDALREQVRICDAYRVLPGIQNFLSTYADRPGLSLGLATGNIERGARIKLEPGDLNRYFRFGGFGSDFESRPALVQCAMEKGRNGCSAAVSPDNVFVIGDTPLDIYAGRKGGFKTVGVATSTYSTRDLEAAGADLVMNDFERDLDQFLRLARIE